MGTNMVLSAITPPKDGNGKPGLEDLMTLNLQLKTHRIINVRNLINLASTISKLPRLVKGDVVDFDELKR